MARHDYFGERYPSLDDGNAFDALMSDVCVGHGYCGGTVDGQPQHVTDYIPDSGPVTADQFVDWVLAADGVVANHKHRPALRAMFVHRMGGETVDAAKLKWSSTIMNDWPVLDWTHWRETAIGLQLRCQIVGKIRLALTPWLNHSWHVPLYLSARGFTTSAIIVGERVLEIEFDLIHDRLVLTTSDGRARGMELRAGTIADFHGAIVKCLDDLDVPSAFDGTPSEMADAVPFAEDHAVRPYDADAARDFWRALIQVQRVFYTFRTGFLGKASPIHLFWGSFDLASTRFSGRTAPRHPGGMPGLPDDVACEAYSHEEASIGFWPGSDAFPHAAFYAYAYPKPDSYEAAKVEPEQAVWNKDLGEFILPYAAVRAADDPDAALLAFCQSTYDAAADLAKWDREHLECPLGRPRVVRMV